MRAQPEQDLVDGEARGPVVDAEVHLLEPLGDTTLVDLIAGGVPLRMVLPEATALGLVPGQPLRIEVLAANAHVFHRETGVRAH